MKVKDCSLISKVVEHGDRGDGTVVEDTRSVVNVRNRTHIRET
jgi:hypothetical protein